MTAQLAGLDAVEMVAHALDAARRGWPVFPVLRGEKRPAIERWEERATTNLTHIADAWSTRFLRCNIGVATGRAGLVVLDYDMSTDLTKPSGEDNFAALGIELPPTYTVGTPSGGTHRYFRAPVGVELRNTCGKLAPKIDTRAHGGYVVAAGSRTADGVYRTLVDVDPAPLPPALLQLLLPPPPPPPAPPVRLAREGRAARYLEAALDAETARVEAAANGQRNHALYIAACALGQLVAGQALDETTAREVLRQAAAGHIAAGAYSSVQAEKTITSGLTAGARRPRQVAS